MDTATISTLFAIHFKSLDFYNENDHYVLPNDGDSHAKMFNFLRRNNCQRFVAVNVPRPRQAFNMRNGTNTHRKLGQGDLKSIYFRSHGFEIAS